MVDALETTSGNHPNGGSKGGSNGNAPHTGSNPVLTTIGRGPLLIYRLPSSGEVSVELEYNQVAKAIGRVMIDWKTLS